MTVHIIVGLSKATKDGENNERTPGIFEETLIKREIIWPALLRLRSFLSLACNVVRVKRGM